MKIAILIDSPTSVYSGVFKALINWTVGLKGDLFILNDSNVSQYLIKRNIKYQIMSDLKNIASLLKEDDCVLYDDISNRLLKALEAVKVFRIIYVYPIWGLRPIGGLPIVNYQSIKMKTMVHISRHIPYR